jgi:hypothetical protein
VPAFGLRKTEHERANRQHATPHAASSMSLEQCSEARAILEWTRRQLVDAAGGKPWVVARRRPIANPARRFGG